MALTINVPYLNLINCLLCMGIWGSGILGTLVYKRFERDSVITPGQGAVIGGLSGIVAAVVGIFFGTIFGTLYRTVGIPGLPNLFGSQSGAFDALQTSGSFSILGFFMYIVIYPIFGAIGGAIGGVVQKKK